MVTIRQHDTARTWTDTLSLAGAPINLTGCTVVLIIKQPAQTYRRAATITSAADGRVSYQPVAPDVAVAGTQKLLWEITFSDGRMLSAPTLEEIIMTVKPTLQ